MTPGRSGDPVAHLAADIASLRREVAALAEKVGDVEGLSEGVADLASRVTELLGSPSGEAQPGPYWFAALEGQAAERAWRELARWVEEVVVDRYQRSVKPCW